MFCITNGVGRYIVIDECHSANSHVVPNIEIIANDASIGSDIYIIPYKNEALFLPDDPYSCILPDSQISADTHSISNDYTHTMINLHTRTDFGIKEYVDIVATH